MASARTRKGGTDGPSDFGPNVEASVGTTAERQAVSREIVREIRSMELSSDGTRYYTSRDDLHDRD